MRKKNFSFGISTLIGSNISNFITVCRKHRIDPPFYGKFLISLFIAGIFELMNAWEKFILKRDRIKIEVKEPPIFIIGFWRSGTTLLHSLLCQDPKAAYTTTYQTVFPNLSCTQAWWLKKFSNLFLPVNRPFDNAEMDMDYPQEEEFGMANLQANSLYNMYLFPGDMDVIFREEFYTGQLPDDQLKIWRFHYQDLLKKAMICTGGSRYISKNPCHLGRLELLNAMYPAGRFIFIYRNPYQVVESLYRFMLAVFPGTQMQKVPADFNREYVVKMYAEIMAHYFRSKEVLPGMKMLEVKMEDFIKNKTGHIQNIYRYFKLPGFEAVEPYIKNYLTSRRNAERPPYEIPVEMYQLMNTYASDIILRLGYPLEKGIVYHLT